MPELIDIATPDSAENCTFYPGDNSYWEAVDLWYSTMNDVEWYNPKQITTKQGKLSILMENVEEPYIVFPHTILSLAVVVVA
jgi:hypothetical protein